MRGFGFVYSRREIQWDRLRLREGTLSTGLEPWICSVSWLAQLSCTVGEAGYCLGHSIRALRDSDEMVFIAVSRPEKKVEREGCGARRKSGVVRKAKPDSKD